MLLPATTLPERKDRRDVLRLPRLSSETDAADPLSADYLPTLSVVEFAWFLMWHTQKKSFAVWELTFLFTNP